MKSKVFHITAASWLIMKRMGVRSLFLIALTLIGFTVLDLLVQSGEDNQFGFIQKYPEFLVMMKAAAVMTFIEMSLFWIRMATQPQNDTQEVARVAARSAMGAAAVYFTQTMQWIVRVILFVYLMGPV